MKKRYGFVSNSSSSSFVALGFDFSATFEQRVELFRNKFKIEIDSDLATDEINEMLEEMLEEVCDYTFFKKDETYDVDTTKIGIIVAEGIEEDGPDRLDIEKKIQDMKLFRDDLGIDTPIHLFWGNKLC